jgi:hypothetical protein
MNSPWPLILFVCALALVLGAIILVNRQVISERTDACAAQGMGTYHVRDGMMCVAPNGQLYAVPK